MMLGTTRLFGIALLMALAACALSASAASAAPEWRFNGSLLTGSGTVEAKAASASLTIPGLTTSCAPFAFELAVENSAGVGVGKVTSVPLGTCTTSSKFCPVESAQATATPWPLHLTGVASGDYLVIEGVKIGFLYGGEECALGGTEVIVKGTAGGLINDSTHTVTFNSSSFSATGTALKTQSQKVEMAGVFNWVATGSNSGAAVTVL